MSLNNLGMMYSSLGKREEAMEATDEAVQHYRALAKARPDAFRPYLALSLNNLGTMYSELGKREEALTVTREALGMYVALAPTLPAVFAQKLAWCADSLAERLEALDMDAEQDADLIQARTLLRELDA